MGDKRAQLLTFAYTYLWDGVGEYPTITFQNFKHHLSSSVSLLFVPSLTPKTMIIRYEGSYKETILLMPSFDGFYICSQ